MKRNFILSFIFILIAQLSTISAQNKPSKQDREKWFQEMREYKHSFLTKELDLSEEQQKKFFPLYDAMEKETFKLNRETRHMAKNLKKSENDISDIEYEKAAEALFELKSKEGQIEMNYFNKFKDVLTKKQLFQLKGAERKFTNKIMKHHNRKKHDKK